MPTKSNIKSASGIEFTVLMAMLMSIAGLAIDMLLPALSQIANDLNIVDGNERQLIITVFMFATYFCGIVFGTLSDSVGRKPITIYGVLIFSIGSIISAITTNFEIMLLGRFLQGVGCSSINVIVMTIIRDKYSGSKMARVQSFILGFTILVPCIAPLLGQGVLFIAPWRAIFYILFTLALLTMIWFYVRQPETLDTKNVRPFNAKSFKDASVEIIHTRIAVCFTFCRSLTYGILIAYFMTAQQIYQDVYNSGDMFAVYFAGLSVVSIFAMFGNGIFVTKFGAKR